MSTLGSLFYHTNEALKRIIFTSNLKISSKQFITGPTAIIVAFDPFLNRFNLPKIDSINDDVFIYKTYSGDSGYFLENSNINYSALVIEGFGSGNVSEFLLPKIKDLLSNGIPVAICTRVPEGPLKTNYNYPGGGKNLRELGCIFYNSIDSHKMRIFLAYLISCKFSFYEINNFFNLMYNNV